MQLNRKFKNSIAFKLAIYFTIVMLVLAIAIGIVFTLLFKQYSMNVHRDNMKNIALSIADVMSKSMAAGSKGMDPNNEGQSGRQSGLFWFDGDGLIRFIHTLTDADVWIIDENMKFITKGIVNEEDGSITYEQLPKSAEDHVKTVFKGYISYSEGYSDVLNAPTLTVGVPIQTNKGIIGVVLLHSSVESINEATNRGLLILCMSIGLALLLGVVLSLVFSHYFARPLRAINNSALMISEGDYSASTGIRRKDEIGELAYTIDEMGDKLSAADREKDKLNQMRQDFVANISHELRTPVTVIRGSLEALCEGVVTEQDKVTEYHRELLKESIYLQRMVNDLLDLSRLQNKDFSINICEFNLCDCISDSVRAARRIASLKGISVNYEYDRISMMYEGDYDRIRQMLLIVLDNAIKFTDNADTPVVLSFRGGAVYISNIGPGIDSASLPYIFDRFYKSRSEQNKNGTGLGLCIAKQIAIRHGIGIKVRSTPGGETVFTFAF